MEPCTNNMAEYNALLIDTKIAGEIGIQNLEVYCDSMLIVNQVCGEFKVCREDLVPYHAAAVELVEEFKSFYIEHVPCSQNAYANTLASHAKSLALRPRGSKKYSSLSVSCIVWIQPLEMLPP